MSRDSSLSRLLVRGDVLESVAPPWRRLGGDPTTVWGWIFRKRFEVESFDARKFWISAVFFSLTLGGLTATKLVQGRGYVWLTIPLITIVNCTREAWKLRLPTSEAHAALPTLTEAREALPVLLIVSDGFGQPTGKDHGWVTFADGWLVYEGLRTEFTLTKAAINLPYEFALGGVTMKVADGRRVTLKPIAADGAPGNSAERGDEQRLIGCIQAWLTESIPGGLSTFPPRALHPEVARERLAFPLVYALAALFLAMVSNAFFGPEIAFLFVIAAVGCFAWLGWGLFQFKHALSTSIR